MLNDGVHPRSAEAWLMQVIAGRTRFPPGNRLAQRHAVRHCAMLELVFLAGLAGAAEV